LPDIGSNLPGLQDVNMEVLLNLVTLQRFVHSLEDIKYTVKPG